MSHSLHQSVAARLYVKFWEKMELIDYNIFQYKHPIIWGTFFLFTVTLPLAPFAVGVAGVLLGFIFSRYLDKKGYLVDKKEQRLKIIELRVSEELKLLELEKERLNVEKLKNETEMSNLDVIDHGDKIKHKIANRMKGTDGHGNPIDIDGNNIF